MLDYKPNLVLSTQEFDVVGTRPIRHDGPDKVTGRARYGADIQLPNLLFGKMLRSPHPHARIRNIDASRALALPGVKAVVTAADLPEVSAQVADLEEGAAVNYGFYSRNVMAREKVLYRGHALAAVAATSAHIAEQALSLIDVDYEVLGPVLNADDAMKDDAPILHERLLTLADPALRPGGWGSDRHERTPATWRNRFQFTMGDIEKGFQEADVIVDREFHTKPVHQGYIEPHSATALWSTDDSVTIWCSSQGHFAVRDHTSLIPRRPRFPCENCTHGDRRRVRRQGTGRRVLGARGSRVIPQDRPAGEDNHEPDRGVRGHGPHIRHPHPGQDGRNQRRPYYRRRSQAGLRGRGLPGLPGAIGDAALCWPPYNIPNVYVEGLDVLVNSQKAAAYRAPGSPPAAFAAESVVDELCQKLGIDPIEFRLRNASEEGTRQAAGPVFRRIGLVETLQAAQQHPHVATDLTGPNRGRGVAAGAWFNGTGPASAVVSVNPDGTVSLVEGSPDIGGSRTAMAMHVAEVLGIPVEEVKPAVVDTDSIGYSSGAGGSGVTFKMGTACYLAAQDVTRQMVDRAAKQWDVDPESVVYDAGVVQHKEDPELKTTFKQLARRLNATGGPIVGRGTTNPGGVGNAFGLHIVDVEVDPDTGKVEILRYTALQDCGKAIHPSYVEGQIQGRRGPRNRLGAERRVLRQRQRPDDELQLPGLPYAHQPGPADDRHGHRRSSEPGPPLRRPRHRRGALGPPDGRHRQRHQATPSASA